MAIPSCEGGTYWGASIVQQPVIAHNNEPWLPNKAPALHLAPGFNTVLASDAAPWSIGVPGGATPPDCAVEIVHGGAASLPVGLLLVNQYGP